MHSVVSERISDTDLAAGNETVKTKGLDTSSDISPQVTMVFSRAVLLVATFLSAALRRVTVIVVSPVSGCRGGPVRSSQSSG